MPKVSFWGGVKRGVVSGLLAACASAGSAQIPTSSQEIAGSPGEKDYIDGAIELKRLAGCAVRKNMSYARSMVASLPGSDTENRVGQAILKVMENCMNDFRPAIWVGFAQMRGALAEELYLLDYPKTPDFEALDHSGMELPKPWLAGKLEGYTLSEVVAHDLAQCTVAANPVLGDSLLRTGPRSQDEEGVIGKLKPFLGPCLMQGYKFQMDAAAVRSYMAQALYRGMAMWPHKSSQSPSSSNGQN